MEYLHINEEQSIELIKSTVGSAKRAREEYIRDYQSISLEDRFDNGEFILEGRGFKV